MNCAASVRLSEGFPNTTSIYAAEGTAAHTLCDHCLRNEADPATFIDEWIDIQEGAIVSLDAPPEDKMRFFLVTEEMADAVERYVAHVRGLIGPECTLAVEERVSMEHVHPAIFGTADATVLDPVARHLHVVDFKYGSGVAVDADENPQLMLYAAGAARRHHNAQIESLTVWVVQPRAPHAEGAVRSYDFDLLELFEFENELADLAKRTEDPSAEPIAGSWCRWCPAFPVCPAAREKAISVAANEFGAIDMEHLPAPESMAPEHIGRVLKEADQIGNWVKAVQEHAHAQACNGNMPAGFKLVAKRAVRRWKDEDEAVNQLLYMGLDANDGIYTEPKLKSPAQLEKLFPGKNKDERQKAMGDLVVKQSSGTNLVPSTDPRPAVTVGADADFESVEV